MQALLGALSARDAIAIAGYFALVLAAGLFFSWKKRTGLEFFFASKNLNWLLIGTSIFSASVSVELLVGFAGAATTSGLAVVALELVAALMLVALAWKVVPFLLASQATTLPQLLEIRFGKSTRQIVSGASVLIYIFTVIALSLSVGTIALKYLLNWDPVFSAPLLALTSASYTLLGGLRAVVITSIIQAGVLVVGLLAMIRYAARYAGAGFRHIVSLTPDETWSLFRSANDTNVPWTGILLGAPVLAFWFVCSNQILAQRIFAAKTVAHARRGVLLAALLKIGVAFLLVLPGIIAYTISRGNVIGDWSLGWMISTFLPPGIRGIAIAAVLAVSMSTLSNAFQAVSTLLTFDFFKAFKPHATESELASFGRVITILFALLGIMSAAFFDLRSDQPALIRILALQASFASPIAAVFLAALIWKRATGVAALVSLVSGLLFGVVRYVLYLSNTGIPIISHPLHSAFALFSLTLAVLIIVSLFSRHTSEEPSLKSSIPAGDSSGRILDLAATMLILGSVILIAILFR